MVVPPIWDGVFPLYMWGRTMWHIHTGFNILRGHLHPTARVFSEIPLDGPRHGTGHVLVMVRLAAEVGVHVNNPYILLRHPLGYGRAGAWWGGGPPQPSVLVTWHQQILEVLPGAGSGGRRSALSGAPHGRGWSAAAAARISKSGWTQNSLDT